MCKIKIVNFIQNDIGQCSGPIDNGLDLAWIDGNTFLETVWPRKLTSDLKNSYLDSLIYSTTCSLLVSWEHVRGLSCVAPHSHWAPGYHPSRWSQWSPVPSWTYYSWSIWTLLEYRFDRTEALGTLRDHNMCERQSWEYPLHGSWSNDIQNGDRSYWRFWRCESGLTAHRYTVTDRCS